LVGFPTKKPKTPLIELKRGNSSKNPKHKRIQTRVKDLDKKGY